MHWQNFWQSPNLLADYSPQYLHAHFLDSHQICWQIYPHPPCWLADFVTVTIPAGRFISQNSPGRFSESNQTCWQIYSPISACRFSDSHQNLALADLSPWFVQAEFLTVTKSAGRFYPQQISVGRLFWQSPHLPADLSPYISAGRFSDSLSNLLADLSPNFLLADILTVS